MGPCLCGDTRCSSCGPAQGNYRCQYCGAWTDEGGCADPAACDRKAEEEIRAEYAEEQYRYDNGG